MKQLITSNMRNIKLMDDIYRLIVDYEINYSSINLDTVLYDAVRDFIYNLELGLDDISKDYIVRLFYTNKGTENVLKLMESHLGIDITYTYNPLNLDLTVNSITTANPNALNERLIRFTRWLLYYHELNLIFKELKIKLDIELDKEYLNLDLITYKEFDT